MSGVIILDQYGKNINSANPFPVELTGSNVGLSKVVSKQRPNDTTAYAANDVVGTSPTTNLEFTSVASAGGTFIVLSARILIDVNAMPSGMSSFKLHLFNAAPTALADNAPFTIAAGDIAKYLGNISIYSLAAVGGSAIFGQEENVNFMGKLADGVTTLYGVLVTDGAYTPTALRTKTITLNIARV